MLKVCGIDSYDDLLLPGHRLLAQLPVFASGEHMRTNTKLLMPDVKILKKTPPFFGSTQPDGIDSEWSLTLAYHRETYAGSISDDSLVILRPIRASLM
jgi:hypothetical protein